MTNVPTQQKLIWLSENPGAELKKVEGAAESASATPNMFTAQTNGDLVSENSFSVSPGSLDINNFEYFNPEGNEDVESYSQDVKKALGRYDSDSLLKKDEFGLFEDQNVQLAVDNGFITPRDLREAGYTYDTYGISSINPPTKSTVEKARKKNINVSKKK